MLRFILFLAIFINLNATFAKCPPDKSAFSMTYPAKFIFLSEDKHSKSPQTVPSTITTAILRELKTDSPKIVFLGTKKTFLLVKRDVEQNLEDSLVREKLSLYEAQPVPFQQDVFESFYDESNKSTVLRQFQGYTPSNGGPDLNLLPSFLATDKIKVTVGPTINQYGAWLTGVGGNVESTSFGVNLLGLGEFSPEAIQSFSTNIFPNGARNLVFDTSWLTLGHIDEVLVEIKNKKDSNGCESTFLINSPQRGLSFDIKGTADKKINLQLQKTFDTYKNLLTKAANNLCKIKFIEVPMLYTKTSFLEKRQVYAAQYPSLTNGLLIKDRYFVVDIENHEIKKSFSDALHEINIKVVWLPLKKLLHSKGLVDGHLHCLTNAIRTCE